MKKFLVPTDFSDTSKNAARYAAQMLDGKDDVQMILYYVYDSFTAGTDGSPLNEDDKDRMVILNQALDNLKAELQTVSRVHIETRTESGSSLVDNVDRVIRHNKIDMVVMGITGANPIEQIFMGSNTLKLVDLGLCPVMIIPPNAKYRTIRNVGLCSDFKEVETTVPLEPIRSVLELFKPSLHVINVDSEHYVDLTEEYKVQRAKLEEKLKDFNPQFYFIRMYDFLEAISQFTTDKNIDVLLTVRKKHSFLSGLFKTSHTRKLAYHMHVPLVAVHE